MLTYLYELLAAFVVRFNMIVLAVYGTAMNLSKAMGAVALLYILFQLCKWGLTV